MERRILLGRIAGANGIRGEVRITTFTARPEDIAETIVWLIEGARQVTGETIFTDGGMHITPPR